MSMLWVRDPDSVLDYTWDWSAWLAAGETIVSHELVNTDATLTIASHSATSTAVTAWFSGGTEWTNSPVTCRITTSEGRTDDRTLTVRTEQR